MYAPFGSTMRIAVLVNPDAGLGGRLGFKGSDGRATEAREAGAEDRSGPRMKHCLENLQGIDAEFVAWSGRMGGDWIPFEYERMGKSPENSSAEDTRRFVGECDADLILYAGGDGTTRDIVESLDGKETPIIGVPGGVKMHSGSFATTPKAAAEVVKAYITGDLMLARTEVMDLDEELYLKGEWRVRMYGEAFTPASPRWMQGAKEQVQRESEEETLDAMAQHISESYSEHQIIWGSGGTLRVIGSHLGVELTLLGIDVQDGDVVHQDLNESSLLSIIDETRPRILLLSPMGGQGFLIGRGNLQLSPEVLRKIGIDNILGIATPAKLLGLNQIRIDTGDGELDAQIRDKRYLKMLQGYRTTRVIKIAT